MPQVGKDYLAEEWGQRLMTLSEFLESHMQSSLSGIDDDDVPGKGSKGKTQAIGYLAQHPLFDQVRLIYFVLL